MAFSWMGVSLDMFIRAIAVLVVRFRDIPENVASPVRALSPAGSFAVRRESAPAAGEAPCRRALKHERQYTGLPWVGRKGRVAGMLQSAQTIRWGVRLDGRGRADG